MAYIIGIGEALWDCLPEGRKIGGAPANFAFHVSQFGLKGLAISAVGDDELGKEMLDVFSSKNLDCMMDVVDYPTGTVDVELHDDGIPCYNIKQGVAWDYIPYTLKLEEVAKNAQAVCFGSLAQRGEVSRNTINKFLDSMSDNDDTLKIFDINLRQNFYNKEIIQTSLEKCNVLKINDEEIVAISRLFGYQGLNDENLCRLLLEKYNLKMLILTCGTNGSYVFSSGVMSFVETPKVEVADTVGAGDSFTAAFISSIIKGKDIKSAHEKAVKVSTFVCTQKGAMPIIPQELR